MWEDVHAVDAAVGEEVQYSDVSGEGVQLEPVRHVVPGPARVQLHLLPRRGVLLAAFLQYNTRNGNSFFGFCNRKVFFTFLKTKSLSNLFASL
jgi:hypothetical protein